MTWTDDQQRRLDELIDKEVNGGGLLLAESRECRRLERYMESLQWVQLISK
jgi:hypothetical protein